MPGPADKLLKWRDELGDWARKLSPYDEPKWNPNPGKLPPAWEAANKKSWQANLASEGKKLGTRKLKKRTIRKRTAAKR